MNMIHKVEPASNAGRLYMSDASEHRLRTLVKHLTLPLMILFLATISALGQLTTSDILGTVTDSTGAEITNATITIRNLDTNDTRTVKTNGNGDYSFNLLQPGHYNIRIEAPGFKSSNTASLAVEAGDRARADAHLEPGASSETITVEAQTPLLQADTATVSSTVTAKAVQDLPLNGRNFVQLVQLTPGANEGPGNGLSSGGRPDDRRSNAAGISVNGQDDTLNNWVVDGIDDNERIIGSIGVKPNVEGIQEITVQTNSYAPEAGRTAGGVINIVTRSGTNQFHGSVYEFFRNDIFDGRSVLQTSGDKPRLRQNQFGGSIGGPVIKDKAFFYFDYEGLRQVVGLTYTKTVPTLSEYNAINSIGGSTPQSLLSADNGTAGLPIDPIALNYLKLFPAPNAGPVGQLTNNYITSPSKTQSSNTYDARVDFKLNDSNQLFARFAYNTVTTFTPPGLGTQNGLQISGGRYDFDGPATDIAQQYALGYTHIFSPRLVLDLRAAFTRINNLSLPLNYGKGADTQVGFPAGHIAFSPFADSLTPVSVGPFADIGDGAYVPLQDIDNTFQYLGTISWTKGNHNIKAGLSFLRRQARNVQSASATGAYQFNLPTDTVNVPVVTNASLLLQQDHQLASTLVGAFASTTRNFNLSPPDYRSYEPSGFVQDSWKITPKLTFIYGLRYDVFTPFTEAHNRISNFDFPQALTLNAQNISSALKIAGQNGVDSKVNIPTDYSNVAPRVGFSLSLAPTTVLRGGYGLSFFPGNYTSNADLKNAPFTSNFSPACQSQIAVNIETAKNQLAGQNGSCAAIPGAPSTLAQGLPVPAAPDITNLAAISGLSFVAEAPKFRSALIQQFNLQVQQQVGPNVFTIGYVGNIGQHLPESINNINQPKPYNPLAPVGSAANPVGGARPLNSVLPNLSGVSYIDSGGVSNYNALQASFQRRFVRGLAFDANYTWAKALSDITGFSQQGSNQGWSNADPTRIRQIEYAIAENDIQNRFALSLNYEFQFGKSFQGFKRALFSGWQANTITVWQSGKPFTITSTGSGVDNPIESDGKPHGFSNRATPQNSGGNDRPNQLGDARGSKSNSQFFNTAAFAPQPLGTVGSAQRNSLFGPNFRHVDLSLFKTFPVTERLNVQFRAESYNISNTPNFYIGNGTSTSQFGSATFGQISQTDPNYTPRLYQFALKAQF
ncbi:TonB-dependent receptor [Terriglobus saanensis]|uniref:TonB-dependent receptor plug n=1 Tax=Terriglobus saanensis (strain ATCC BAA-1853 / DSM 23119 / SP1PR4) TaxID=401053 RepID=E8UZ73_TERSS|nr:TonB-dependent receptor [Terriglobus saanensis]ADV82091.1 TonB-dependent receptor plug [Terriglobus saanensis SP1PR4]